MLRDMLRSTLATALLGLSAALFSIASCNAAPANCPGEIAKLKPANGDLFIASSANGAQRIRAGRGEVKQPITLKPDDNISIYYFANPAARSAPMIFALIRAYKIRPGHSTSLKPTEVRVSHSTSRGQPVTEKDYTSFHAVKHRGPNDLRKSFHMVFYENAPIYDIFSDADNSYDDVDDPSIYSLPTGPEFSGFKAHMQRISGFAQDGTCVRFTLFNKKAFAQALASFSLSLIALADEGAKPDDHLRFSISFATAP